MFNRFYFYNQFSSARAIKINISFQYRYPNTELWLEQNKNILKKDGLKTPFKL